MRVAALPSPKGASRSKGNAGGRGSESIASASATIASRSTATSRTNPAAMPSGRSVQERGTSKRDAEMRHLFLDAAGVADDQRRARGRRDEVAIVHRRHQRELRLPAQPLADARRDARIRMHRHQHPQVRPRRAERDQRIADDVGLAVPVLAPMQRDEHLVARRARAGRREVALRQEPPQAVDARVADVVHAGGRHAFREQVPVRGSARSEVMVRVPRDAAPEPLLRKGIRDRRRAQSGLDVHDRISRAGARPRTGVCGERVALHDHERRAHLPDHRREPFREMAAGGAQVRLRRKCRQFDVGFDVELGERAAHRVHVLPAVHDNAGKRGPVREFADHRRELDALRPRARDHERHPSRTGRVHAIRTRSVPRRLVRRCRAYVEQATPVTWMRSRLRRSWHEWTRRRPMRACPESRPGAPGAVRRGDCNKLVHRRQGRLSGSRAVVGAARAARVGPAGLEPATKGL